MAIDYYRKRDMIKEALLISKRFNHDRLAMIYRTGFVESDFIYTEDKVGKAYSNFQLELETVQSLFYHTYPNLDKSDPYWSLPIAIFAGKKLPFSMIKLLLTAEDVNDYGLYIPVWLCDLKYRTNSDPIPSHFSIREQGKYWKKVYNTEGGAGTNSYFINKVTQHEQNVFGGNIV